MTRFLPRRDNSSFFAGQNPLWTQHDRTNSGGNPFQRGHQKFMLSRGSVKVSGILAVCLFVCAAASAQYGGGGTTGGSGTTSSANPANMGYGSGSGKAIGIGVGAAAGAAVAIALLVHHHRAASRASFDHRLHPVHPERN